MNKDTLKENKIIKKKWESCNSYNCDNYTDDNKKKYFTRR